MSKRNPFQLEVEKRFGDSAFELDAFKRGNRKITVTREYIEDTYDIKLEEFAYYAESSGFKVMAGHDDLLIFK